MLPAGPGPLYGIRYLPVKRTGRVIGESDFIFNTIPSLVLDAALANQVQENAAVIDIAPRREGWISKPLNAGIYGPDYVPDFPAAAPPSPLP